MTYRMYSVYDSKALVYSAPMCIRNDAEAKRVMTSLYRDPGNMISQYPEDYTMMCLADYDDCLGEIVVLPAPVSIMRGVDCKNVANAI